MRAFPLPPNVLGVDTWNQLAPFECRALRNLSYKFREGYLDRLTPEEVRGQLGEGLPLVLYTFGNQSDPDHALARLHTLGIPGGVSVVYDLEALWKPGLTAAQLDDLAKRAIDDINKWGARLQGQGFLPCLYYAAGSLLTSAELYALRVYRYHAGASENLDRFGHSQDPFPRGAAMIQGRPVEFTIGAIPGKKFDADFHRQDAKGDVFIAVAA